MKLTTLLQNTMPDQFIVVRDYKSSKQLYEGRNKSINNFMDVRNKIVVWQQTCFLTQHPTETGLYVMVAEDR